MKKIVLTIVLLLFIAAAFLSWEFFGPATAFKDEKYYLYVKTDMTYEEELKILEDDHVLASPLFFNWLAKYIDLPKARYATAADQTELAALPTAAASAAPAAGSGACRDKTPAHQRRSTAA